MKKLLLFVIGTMLAFGAYGQSKLPPCQGSDVTKWSNCFGTTTWPNGDKYVGEFRDGSSYGRGIQTYADGHVVEGICADDKFVRAEKFKNIPGFYIVKKGDTLLGISQQFNQSWRDLADWNKLNGAIDIMVGQVLLLTPPEMSVPIVPEQAVSAPVNDVRFSWPAEGKIISAFDQTRKGIDIAGEAGQAIVAAGEGTVLYAKNMRGYGNLIIVDHSDGLVSAYAHNKTILVKEGQNVAKGQRIAEMGNSDSDIVKLHFEIRQLGKPVDPVGLLPGR